MNATKALTFLWSSWSLAASVFVVLATAALCFFAWRRSGYRRDYGLVELLRLVIVALAVFIFNQPEWVEEYRPNQKPTIAVLYDGSRSMETRDVESTASATPTRTSRKESIAPLIDKKFWAKLEDKHEIAIQPFAVGESAKGSNLYDPLAQAPEKFKN